MNNPSKITWTKLRNYIEKHDIEYRFIVFLDNHWSIICPAILYLLSLRYPLLGDSLTGCLISLIWVSNFKLRKTREILERQIAELRDDNFNLYMKLNTLKMEIRYPNDRAV